MAANILSYQKLLQMHSVLYRDTDNTFVATPLLLGPVLVFGCMNGHYILDLNTIVSTYFTSVNEKAAKRSKRQLMSARKAYEFIIQMGFINYKSKAEVIQRRSIKDFGFTRSDLVNAQDIYGPPAAYQLAQGTQRKNAQAEDDPMPAHESVDQELQVDLFFFLGQAFFISISVLLGLIMVTHLGSGIDRGKDPRVSHAEGAKSKAGRSLLMHIQQYAAKGFVIKHVTSDGEASVSAVKSDVEALGVEVNILGHGSHTPHAEAAIRHIMNKARSTMYSLPYSLPSKLAAALIAFVVHTANMVPKVNAVGHLPAHTAFMGRIPNFPRDGTPNRTLLEQLDSCNVSKARSAILQHHAVTTASGSGRPTTWREHIDA